MNIVILASTPEAAAEMRAALGEAAKQCAVTAAWQELSSFCENCGPDLILIERTMLSQIDPPTLVALSESGRWPPLLIMDALASGAQNGSSIVQRLTQKEVDSYQVGDLHIDARRRRVRLGERSVTLPPIQYRILVALAKRVGEVVATRELLRAAWGYEATESEARDLVKAHIRQIRRRLGLDSEKQYYIHSVRGFGYMLTPLDED